MRAANRTTECTLVTDSNNKLKLYYIDRKTIYLKYLKHYIAQMHSEETTVGPITPDTRDRIKAFRDETGQPHYEAALKKLLQKVEEE